MQFPEINNPTDAIGRSSIGKVTVKPPAQTTKRDRGL
jgi:hypothetical protein